MFVVRLNWPDDMMEIEGWGQLNRPEVPVPPALTDTHRAARGSASTPDASSVLDFLEQVLATMDSAKEGMEEWRDNLDNANMSGLPKYDEVSAACDALDSASGSFSDASDTYSTLNGSGWSDHGVTDVTDLEASCTIDTRKASLAKRSGQVANAIQQAYACQHALEAWKAIAEPYRDSLDEALREGDPDDHPDDDPSFEYPLAPAVPGGLPSAVRRRTWSEWETVRDDLSEDIDNVTDILDAIESGIGEAEAIEWPVAFG